MKQRKVIRQSGAFLSIHVLSRTIAAAQKRQNAGAGLVLLKQAQCEGHVLMSHREQTQLFISWTIAAAQKRLNGAGLAPLRQAE